MLRSVGRLKEIADYLAKTVNVRVVIPRLLDDPCFEGGTEGDGLPPGFDEENRAAEMKTWLMKYTWESFRPKVQAAVVKLRSDGCKRIAGVGFGFGAWIISKMSVDVGEFVGSAHMYPETETFELMNSRDPEMLAKKMRGAVFFITCASCSETYGVEGEIYETVLENYCGTEIGHFPDMQAGFPIRGDCAKPGVRPNTEKAVAMATRHCRKFLWPPPPGANAASLRIASKDGDAEMVASLILAGVPVTGMDSTDAVGLTPMLYAAREGHSQPVRLLLEAEADPNEAGGIGNETPLHVAAVGGRSKVCKVFLEAGCLVEPIDKNGQTPLHYAASAGQQAVCKQLLLAKASVEPRDTGGQTPLHLAAFGGRQLAVLMLLVMKGNVSPEDLRVKTPQKRAVEAGFITIADLLTTEREKREVAEWVASNPGLDKDEKEEKGAKGKTDKSKEGEKGAQGKTDKKGK